MGILRANQWPFPFIKSSRANLFERVGEMILELAVHPETFLLWSSIPERGSGSGLPSFHLCRFHERSAAHA